MRIILTILFALNILVCEAQLSLEHTYYVNHSYFTVIHLDGESDKYARFDTLDMSLNLYNEDHSLWKSMKTNIPNGNSITPYWVSNKLINSDNAIEFCVGFYHFDANNKALFTTRIYDENGNILYDWFGVSSCIPLKINTDWKLVNREYPSGNINIYSVPGQYLGIVPMNEDNSGSTSAIYPNPMNNSATISYTLPSGKRNGIISIFNINGQLVRQYKVTDQFNSILIKKDDLSPGTYLYQLSGDGYKETSQKFTVY